MTPDLYIGGLCVLAAGAGWLLLKNRDLRAEARILTEQDANLREALKGEYEKFDKATSDLKEQIKFKNARLEDWAKADKRAFEELAKDKEILREKVGERNKELNEVKKELGEEKEARKKVLSQKKSGEVRLGHIAEKLAPFLEDFTYDPSNASFLGQPIDYVVFEDEEIVFVEIKSGKAKLSPKQKHIKELIQNKCVSWKEIRID